MYDLLKTRVNYALLALLALAFVTSAAVMETLNVDSLLNTDSMFANANLLIAAVGGIVLVVVGFKLAVMVIRFVLNIFDGLRF